MKKICFVLLIALIFVLPSCNRKSISEIDNKAPLNGEQTAELISTIYQEIGPRLGSHLVEPNAVLTLSGLRGVGNFLTHNLTEEEKNKIEKLNEKIKNRGIVFVIWDDKKEDVADITIYNFNGLEYTSKLSKLPFVKPYDSSTGLEGIKKWVGSTYTAAENYLKKATGAALSALVVGLRLGYPDQALLDAADAISNNINWDELADSKIPYSDYYHNPQPNFSYFPQHEEDPTIARTRESWGKLLKEFYNTKWHMSLAQDSIFINMRKSEAESHNNWLVKKVSN